MPFNSLAFILFFGCVFVVHSLPLPWRSRKCNLLVASYLFYASWNPWFVLLLLSVTVSNWLAAIWIHRWDAFPRARRFVLWHCVALNLGVLVVFKYGNELLAAWDWVAPHLHAGRASRREIWLPVGLSFFTFQALSYTVDVYRRTIRPATSALDFALFVSFFPVLLAGPLLRAGQFLPQCASSRRASGEEMGLGGALITLGLFLKVVLADHLLAPVVQRVFASHVQPDALSAWAGTIAFAGQDYCDFAGYSIIAMGLGLCLGFLLPENFRAPFASLGFRDLWQRWHITLVAWMRDYVFNSLGGVYKGYRRAALNVLVVFLLIGLWHGAAWTYLIFGLLHGTYLIVETLLQRSAIRRQRIWSSAPGNFMIWFATMFLCCVAVVFYRTADLDHAWRMLRAMSGFGRALHPFRLSDFDLLSTLVVMESLIVAHWLCRKRTLSDIASRGSWYATAVALAGMLLAIALSRGPSQSFLYFHY